MRAIRLVSLGGAVICATWGCALHDQVQYFAASDPETGNTSYYRMTVSGWGGLGTDYHMQAGYFSAQSVDVLRGSMPDIPLLDLPVEQIEVFDRLTEQFYAALIQEAKRQAPISDVEALYVSSGSQQQLSLSRQSKAKAEADDYEQRAKIAQDHLTQLKDKLKAQTASRDDAQKELNNHEVKMITDRSALKTLQRDVQTAQSSVVKAESTLNELNGQILSQQAIASSTSASQPDKTKAQEAIAAIQQLITEQKKKISDAQDAALKASGKVNDQLALLEANRHNLILKQATLSDANDNINQVQHDIQSATDEASLLQQRLARARREAEVQQSAASAAAELRQLLSEQMKSAPIGMLAEGSNAKPFRDPQVKRLARTVFYGSLSQSDIASIGATRSTDPYKFRKLVFWATAKNIDLNQFANDIDNTIAHVTTIAGTYKNQAKQRKAVGAARKEAVNKLIDTLPLSEQQKTQLGAILSVTLPDNSKSSSPWTNLQPSDVVTPDEEVSP